MFEILGRVEMAVVDEAIRLETVKLFDDVAIKAEPSELDVMMEFGEKDVALVPPFAIANVPLKLPIVRQFPEIA